MFDWCHDDIDLRDDMRAWAHDKARDMHMDNKHIDTYTLEWVVLREVWEEMTRPHGAPSPMRTPWRRAYVLEFLRQIGVVYRVPRDCRLPRGVVGNGVVRQISRS